MADPDNLHVTIRADRTAQRTDEILSTGTDAGTTEVIDRPLHLTPDLLQGEPDQEPVVVLATDPVPGNRAVSKLPGQERQAIDTA